MKSTLTTVFPILLSSSSGPMGGEMVVVLDRKAKDPIKTKFDSCFYRAGSDKRIIVRDLQGKSIHEESTTSLWVEINADEFVKGTYIIIIEIGGMKKGEVKIVIK